MSIAWSAFTSPFPDGADCADAPGERRPRRPVAVEITSRAARMAARIFQRVMDERLLMVSSYPVRPLKADPKFDSRPSSIAPGSVLNNFPLRSSDTGRAHLKIR